MKSFLKNIKIFFIIFVLLSVSLLTGLIWQQHRSQSSLWAAAGENKHTLRSLYALAGSIYTRDNITLATSEQGGRQYSSDPVLAASVLQLVGDYTHIMGNTIEAAYQPELMGNERNIFRRVRLDFTGEGLRGDDLQLTIDSRLNKIAYTAMQGYKGAAVLLNYKTGEVLAMTSTPSTAPVNVINYKNIPDTALLNRAINGVFPPGSTFKMITAASFIKSERYDPNFTVKCTGAPLFNAAAKEIYGHGHGIMNLTDGFANSCNIFFGEVGRKVGLGELQQMAETWGWNSPLSLDRLRVNTSRFSCPEHDEAILTWASIGQPVGDIILQVTPLQLALQAATVANDGEKPEPHIIAARRDPTGKVYHIISTTNSTKTVMSPEQAGLERKLMEHAVATGFVRAIDIRGLEVGAKSGTAEVAGQAATGLIAAYVKNDAYPLAVAVILENCGAGAGVPLQVARQLLVNSIALYPNGIK